MSAPNDLPDLESKIADHDGIENSEHGFMLLRLFRLVKQLAARVKALEDARP